MDLETFKEQLEELLEHDEFIIDISDDGEIIVRTGFKNGPDGELVRWHEDEDDEDEDDEEIDSDLEPFIEEDSDDEF